MDPEYVVRWNGAHLDCDADLFHPPEFKDEDEDDPSAVHVIVPEPSPPPLDVTERQADVLAAMGAAWTRPCTVARKMGVSSDTAWWTLRQLAQAGAVECRNTVEPRAFSRGVRWYRRMQESSR